MGTGKKKIEIKRKEKEADRLVAFSKRRKGLFKKAHQLHSLSNAKLAILVFSPAGKIYIYGDPCFYDIVDNFYLITSANPNVSTSCRVDEDMHRDFQACKSWLETMDVEGCDNVDDLVAVKNDLEQIRDELIKTIGEVGVETESA